MMLKIQERKLLLGADINGEGEDDKKATKNDMVHLLKEALSLWSIFKYTVYAVIAIYTSISYNSVYILELLYIY